MQQRSKSKINNKTIVWKKKKKGDESSHHLHICIWFHSSRLLLLLLIRSSERKFPHYGYTSNYSKDLQTWKLIILQIPSIYPFIDGSIVYANKKKFHMQIFYLSLPFHFIHSFLYISSHRVFTFTFGWKYFIFFLFNINASFYSFRCERLLYDRIWACINLRNAKGFNRKPNEYICAGKVLPHQGARHSPHIHTHTHTHEHTEDRRCWRKQKKIAYAICKLVWHHYIPLSAT